MRTFLFIVAGFWLTIVVAVLGAAGVVSADLNQGLREGAKFLQESDGDVRDSQAFYEEIMPRVLFDPTPEYLMQVWAPEERAHLGRDALDRLIARIATKPQGFQRCGVLLVTMDSTFEAKEGLFRHESKTGLSATISATYYFSEGSIEVTTVLKKEGGVWGLTALDLSDRIAPISKTL